jgi:peptidyl-prolyl cis-trans isomerase C
MYRHRIIAGICTVAFFLTAGCNISPGAKVLARIDNESITQKEFQAKLDRLPPYYRAAAREQKEKFLDELINEKIFLKEAYKNGVDKNKEVQELVKEARNKIIATKFIEEQINKNIYVADSEIEDYYARYKKEFVTPTRYKASHILVSTERQAEEALNRLSKGEDFAVVAKEVSIDPSRTNGGDLGYFTEGQMIPDFESACFKLDVGQTSAIVKTQFGYHIIKLTDKKPSQAKALNEVADQIKRRIRDAKKSDRLQELVKDLRSKYSIKINKELLQSKDE